MSFWPQDLETELHGVVDHVGALAGREAVGYLRAFPCKDDEGNQNNGIKQSERSYPRLEDEEWVIGDHVSKAAAHVFAVVQSRI